MIDLNYNVYDAGTDNIHVVIPVIDRIYDINDIVTANLTKSRELSGNSSHSLGLQYRWYQDKKSSEIPENYVVLMNEANIMK